MKPEDLLALLPSGDKPSVAVAADGTVSLTYAVEQHAVRASADDAAIRAAFAVSSAEQVDIDHRGGDGRLISTTGYVVRYVLAPKPPAPKPPKSNG